MTPLRRLLIRPSVTMITLGVALATSGCSTPTKGVDPLATGRKRVLELVNDTGSALPSHTELGTVTRSGRPVDLGFVPVTTDDLDRENCYRKVLGFSTGKTGAEQPEVRAIIDLPETTNPKSLLPDVERLWRQSGYTVDTRRLSDSRYPQLRATTGDYTLYATSLAESAGFGASPRLTLYAVAACQTTTGNPPRE